MFACTRWTVAVVLVLSLAWTLRGEAPPASKGPAVRLPQSAGGQKSDDGGKRLREGTKLIDAVGRFDSSSDRWVFFLAESDESYKVLENLSLERIHKVLEETRASEKPLWIISGTMTEFAGANYLLVSKAVIKPQSDVTAERPRSSSQTHTETP